MRVTSAKRDAFTAIYFFFFFFLNCLPIELKLTATKEFSKQ
jgi:hypothetical protein